MFTYEPPLNPPCDRWHDYLRPQLCRDRMEDICKDILNKGSLTRYLDIYESIYQLVESQIDEEHEEAKSYE